MLGIIRQSHEPLDDDQIALAAQMNRVYVNVICRQLASEKLVIRSRGRDGKLVNVAADGVQAAGLEPTAESSPKGVAPTPGRNWIGCGAGC